MQKYNSFVSRFKSSVTPVVRPLHMFIHNYKSTYVWVCLMYWWMWLWLQCLGKARIHTNAGDLIHPTFCRLHYYINRCSFCQLIFHFSLLLSFICYYWKTFMTKPSLILLFFLLYVTDKRLWICLQDSETLRRSRLKCHYARKVAFKQHFPCPSELMIEQQ